MPEYMLTTVDNPYDPFTEWDEWFQFDVHQGYNTSAFLARIVTLSPDLPETEQQAIIEQAIDEIIDENVSGMWRKVSIGDVQKDGGRG
jgi:hypothetical protein